MAFDPKKPHGIVHGEGELHRYEQDGKRYDADGNEVVGDKVIVPKPKKGDGGAAAKPEASEVDKQIAAQVA